MDAETLAAMKLTAGVVLGLAVQWLKGPKKLPLWAAYGIVGVLATAIFIWITPDFTLSASTWRLQVFTWLTFIMSARGWGSTTRDVRLAPATNSIG